MDVPEVPLGIGYLNPFWPEGLINESIIFIP